MNPADANSPPRKISPTRSSDSSLFPEVVPPELAVLQENLAFDAVFQSSSEPLLVVDSQGRIENANAPARALLRLPRNPPAGAAYLGHCLAAAAADSAGQFWKQCAQLGESPKTLDASLRSGFPIRIALRAVLPASGQLLLCLGEASPAQRADAKAKQLEAELRSVLESVNTGIALFDSTGQARFFNIRFGQFFGLDARELETLQNVRDLHELVAGRFHDPQAFVAPWNSFDAGRGEPGHDELEILRPSRRVLERFFRPVLGVEGRPSGWLELYADVTGERQIQAKILQAEKAAALGQLVSGIAHELNNPLTAIMGYAQLLLGRGLLPAQLSEVGMVYQEAERARRIVKNLLYFARETQPERTRVDLNEIVERTLALRSYELRVENIAVQCQLSSGLPVTMADPHQLQQVVLNLIVNAEQALLEERGQGNIRIRTYPGVHRRGQWICLGISDDGPGILPEIASRIFDPFFTTKPSGLGTGLGLSIVYGIIQQHNGEISFESQRGHGTKFLVEVPVVAVAAAQAPADERAPSSGPAQARLTGRILVVEDEPTVAHLIVDVLREEDHDAEFVLESPEGLTRLSRSHYDLVICDLRMPRLDGFAFYDALVRSGSPAQNGVIFITGDVLASRTREFLEQNGRPYLAKPFLVEELKLAVNRVLESLRTESEMQGKLQEAASSAKSNG